MVIVPVFVCAALTLQSHWFADREYEVTFTDDAGTVAWQLCLGRIPLARGKVTGEGRDEPAMIRVVAPKVRGFTTLTLRHTASAGARAGETLSEPVYVYPAPDWRAEVKRLAGRPVTVIGGGDGASLADWFSSVGLQVRPSRDAIAADFGDGPLIVVASDAIAKETDVRRLRDAARDGRHVFVLPQKPREPLADEIALEKIDDGARVALDAQHPLLAGLDKAVLESWRAAMPATLALRLGPDMPLSVAIGVDDAKGRATHALLGTQKVGRGSITWLTLPWRDPSADPRLALLVKEWIRVTLDTGEPK